MTAAAGTPLWRDLIHKPFFWGIVAIVALLALNVLKDPTYLALSINPNNGNLVGNLVDILRQAAPVMMIAVVVAVIVMLVAAEPLSAFIAKNPTVVMLALGFLIMIGMTLIAEGFGAHVPKSGPPQPVRLQK